MFVFAQMIKGSSVAFEASIFSLKIDTTNVGNNEQILHIFANFQDKKKCKRFVFRNAFFKYFVGNGAIIAVTT